MKAETCPARLGRGNVLGRVKKWETCPAGLGRGNMHWLG